MRIILCGPYLTENMEMLLPEASPAAGKFLRNLKRGLLSSGHKVVVLSYQSIQVPDVARKALVREIQRGEEQEEYYVFKKGNPLQAVVAYRAMIYSYIKKGDVVLFYNSIYPTVLMQRRIHRKGAQAGIILADYTEPEEHHSLARKLVAYICKYDMKKYDKYVMLSCSFMNILGRKNNSILVQGGIDDSILGQFSQPHKTDVCNLYYSGLLSEENGVKNMVAAFRGIKAANIRLVVSGKGPLEKYVKEEAEKDKRIVYVGYVENKRYYTLLEQADILVNPRNMELPQNSNNFPSKIMEYLASGRIIISTRFPSWEQFEENILFCDSDVDSIITAMKKACSMTVQDMIDNFYKNITFAQKFSWTVQSQRIEKIFCSKVLTASDSENQGMEDENG